MVNLTNPCLALSQPGKANAPPVTPTRSGLAMSSQRTIVITGCSNNSLGCALALSFKKAGWRVFATGRTSSKLGIVKKAGIETVLLDTLSHDSIANCVANVQALTGGSLDALLNNAGAGYSMPLLDVDIEKAQELFDVNVWALIRVTRSFLPLILRSKMEDKIVVNNTACAAITAGTMPFSGVYNASKAAAASLTEAMRLELEPFGIRVINMMTGAVRSGFHNNAPTATLPPTSLYNVAKDAVEKVMSGADADNGADPEQWADLVVKDLSKHNAPYWVWRGKFSLLVRIASHLPVGFLDRSMKTMVGLDVVERKIQDQKSETGSS